MKKLKIKYDGITHTLIPELMFELYFINEIIGTEPVHIIIEKVLAVEGINHKITIDLERMVVETPFNFYAYDSIDFIPKLPF